MILKQAGSVYSQAHRTEINSEINCYGGEGYSKGEVKGIILRKEMMMKKEKKWWM